MKTLATGIIAAILALSITSSLCGQKFRQKSKSKPRLVGKLLWHGDISKIISPATTAPKKTQAKTPRHQKLILWLRLLGELEGKS